ncbi:PilN domain-containing protein [Thiolinea disciformis]|uniref:PilN domain-containing protein n=1 Tax=Thiolinea disciformis TaxID=125614 RepID=UPI0003615EE5|nr:PilN domain-containing protein [Thiolinea disciformis]
MALTTFKAALIWWKSNLYAGLPPILRGLFQTHLPRLAFSLGEQQLAVHWLKDGKQQVVGNFRLDKHFNFQTISKKYTRRPHHLELMLSDKQALLLQHTFPEAVLDNLKQVVSYQIDRLTPFQTDAVYFNAQVAQHDKARKELKADIYLAPTVVVDKLVQQLASLGIPTIQRISAKQGAITLSKVQDIALDKQLGWSKWPLYIFGVALIASLLFPLLYKQRRLEQIDAALATVKSASAQQLDVRDKLMAADEALRFLQERRKAAPLMLEVVERLSAVLPSDTWLERMEVNGTTVQIRGESSAALSLIDTLEASPSFAKVSFKSPVTRNAANGKDKFHIEAQVEPVITP